MSTPFPPGSLTTSVPPCRHRDTYSSTLQAPGDALHRTTMTVHLYIHRRPGIFLPLILWTSDVWIKWSALHSWIHPLRHSIKQVPLDSKAQTGSSNCVQMSPRRNAVITSNCLSYQDCNQCVPDALFPPRIMQCIRELYNKAFVLEHTYVLSFCCSEDIVMRIWHQYLRAEMSDWTTLLCNWALSLPHNRRP